MKEIKFRVWDKKNKVMRTVYSVNMTKNGLSAIVANSKKPYNLFLPSDCIVLMQYTGLKDKNCKEIYDKDILRQKKDSGRKFKVFWNEDGKWMVEDLEDGSWKELWAWAKNTEVIDKLVTA